MRDGWKKVCLGDVCRVIPGYAFSSKDWCKDGIPVIKIKNITQDCRVDLTDTDCVPDYVFTPKLEKFVLKDRDILVAMTGATAGKVGKLRTGKRVLLNQRVAKIEPVEADKDFIWSVVSSAEYQSRFYYLADGAAQPNMSGSQIEGVEVLLPPISVQRKIAGVLAAYDELIENNSRRIKLLEQMAQALYREWFVHPCQSGKLPKGWETKKLGEVIELAYGKALKEEDRRGGEVPVYGSSGVVGYHNESYVKGSGIVVGRKGNVGSVFWSDADFWPIDTAFYVVTKLSLPYVFYNLQHQTFLNNDAAVPGLSRNAAYLKLFVLPAAALMEAFDEFVLPIFAQLRTLNQKNANLRRTRDLLLPKLISGEVEVN